MAKGQGQKLLTARLEIGQAVHSVGTMLKELKLLGLAVGFLGIAIAFLDLLGYFVDQDRVALRDNMRGSSGGIPRHARGFDKFMKRFPPPGHVDQAVVTHIVKDILQTHDRFPINITLRYLAADNRTAPVATFSDVERWAAETRFGWVSWIVAAVGWLVVAATELYSMFSGGE